METVKKNKVFPIRETSVHAYKIPTEEPESDGTLEWDHTILVLAEMTAGDHTGIGYTYADSSTAHFINEHLFPLLSGEDVLDNTRLWDKMQDKVRNLGRPGITSMAISAVDNALWDLKARCLDLPLCKLLGQKNKAVQVYASGGFTSYDSSELYDMFSVHKDNGHTMFKMKIGRKKAEDLDRLKAAREAIGELELMVDANGAYYPKEALEMAEHLREYKVSWYEEPVTSDNLPGMRMLRINCDPSIKVAAGEYGYTSDYFLNMLQAQAVDVVQADATRCMGITGFMKVSDLCEAFHTPLSAHCAPALHLHPALAMNNILHVEYFRDHARIENELFEGSPRSENGKIHPDLTKNGIGLDFRFKDAEKYKI